MFTNILLLLGSFFTAWLVSIPFIKLLYIFNIRRVSKAELDSILPGRQVKLGTPIMGGAVILFSILFWSYFILGDWEYFPAIVVLCVLGGVIGAIDEYTNTLGRTIRALRISGANDGYSFIPVKSKIALSFKNLFLKPWQSFEELLRMMGSEQKGLKSHYKFMTHVILALIVAGVFYYNDHGSFFNITSWIYIDLGILYPLIFLGSMLFMANAFGVTDGMDGLSAGMHAVSFALYGMMASYLEYPEVAALCFIITGAELAFLYFNIHPARMEMSDVGTLPLGMLLVVVAFAMNKEISLLFLGAVYIVELLSSILQVWSVKTRGKKIFLIAPIHHHFEKMGWPETKVTNRFWLVNCIVGLIGLLIALL